MISKYDSISYDDEAYVHSETFKHHVKHLDGLIGHLRHSREKSIVLTKLEGLHMWINKAIRADQLIREENEKDRSE